MSRTRRPPLGKKIKPTFFVFCEGKTEEQYVKFLKTQYRIPIEIDSKIAGSDISDGYIERYKRIKVTHEKDKTFLLYDLDVSEMLKQLKKIQDTQLLVSNPCFELWYLLHFKEQKAEVDCKYCVTELAKRNSFYIKGSISPKLKDNLIYKQLKAVHRARKLESYSNPSSTVYLLVEALEKVKSDL